MKNIIILFLILAVSAGSVSTSEAKIFKSKKKKNTEVADTIKKATPPSKYEKMFVRDKNVQTAKSDFITIHKLKEKLYFELPEKYLQREMLLSTAITEASNPDLGIIGYKPKRPMHIKFVKIDSTIYMSQVSLPLGFAPDKYGSMSEAVRSSSLDPMLSAFKIVCNNRGSVVFEVTGLFVGSENKMSPLPEQVSVLKFTNNFRKETSALGEFKAFDDNVTVKSYLSYSVSASLLGMASIMKNEPVTVKVTRTLLLLPEVNRTMRARISDSRVGIFLSNKKTLAADEDQIVDYSVIHRWNLQPKDTTAFLEGELTEPIKPIVFYLDDAFPELWREAAREGILRWNSAFEKIGFKNVVQVLDYPKDDPEFDPDNLKYSCVRYVPVQVENAMGPSWVDPRTGEIISASVIVYNDIVKLLNRWRFVQTAQVDELVRAKKMPDNVMKESVAYVLAHEVGHCLGFMHNMAASAAYPTDSLRSPEFTHKYGTTPSIMDYARFNYVAQPGDKEVALTPPGLGAYDYFLVKYAYTPIFDAKDTEEERKIIEAWVDEKAGDPVYRYGRQQIIARYDPSAIEEDLGDNAIKSSDYGIKNLKYILANLNEWITDEADPDATHRQSLYSNIIAQYSRYMRAVSMNIGGIYLTEVKAGTPGDRFSAVPKEKQRESLKWVLKQLKDSGWLSDKKVTDNFNLALSRASVFRYQFAKSLFTVYQKIMLSSHISNKPYTTKEYFDDIYRFVWASAINGRPTTEADRQMQMIFVEAAAGMLSGRGSGTIIVGPISSANVYAPSIDDINAFGLDETGITERYEGLLRDIEAKEGIGIVARSLVPESEFGYGYGWQSNVSLQAIDNSKTLFHAEAKRILDLLKSRVPAASGDTKAHYQAMIFVLEKALSTK